MQKAKWVLAAAWVALAGCGSPKQQSAVYPHNMHGPQAAIGLHFPRVVFIGDSVTYTYVTAANNPDWINAATNGPELSASMLARFQSDVVNQHPDVVVILAGTYDFQQQDWFAQNEDVTVTLENLGQMVTLAKAANIAPIVCTIPLQGLDETFTPEDGSLDAEIDQFNFLQIFQSIALGGGENDPFEGATMVDFEMDLKPGWTTNGIDPNAQGDQVMIDAVSAKVTALGVGGVR